MADQGESSGSSRSSKRLCKRKYFTTADVLATNVDPSDESNNESDFFDGNSEIDEEQNDINIGGGEFTNNHDEPCNKDSLFHYDESNNSDDDNDNNDLQVQFINDNNLTIIPSSAQVQRRGDRVRGGRAGQPSKNKKTTIDPNWEELKDEYNNQNGEKQFHEYVGINRAAAGAVSILEHFLLFFTMDIIEQITAQTNLYYQQESIKKTLPDFKTTKEEILAFLGINIAMGIARLPAVNDYWSKGITAMPWFLPRNKFKNILRFLHLADNSKQVAKDQPGYNKLHKLGGLHTQTSKLFSSMLSPKQSISIDEQMIGTKGRCSFIQYMPKKPTRFGIKVWALCESISGYCLDFQIYTGKVENVPEHGLSYRVVFDLLSKYLGKSYHVFFDNFYTSFKLVKDLEEQQTFACGTIRKNRGQFPDSFITAKLALGSSLFIRNGNILAVHWKDKRDVFVLSSFHGNSIENIQRYSGDITKPNIICEYNKNMGGVDKCDQYLSYYALTRKSMKWWKKVFFRLFEMCIVNAMCIFFEKNPEFAKKKNSHKIFRLELVHEMVQLYLDIRTDEELETRGRHISMTTMPHSRRQTDDNVRLRGKHFAVRMDVRRKCTMCAYKRNPSTGKRMNTRTNDYCEKCEKYVCKSCFKTFHTVSKL